MAPGQERMEPPCFCDKILAEGQTVKTDPNRLTVCNSWEMMLCVM